MNSEKEPRSVAPRFQKPTSRTSSLKSHVTEKRNLKAGSRSRKSTIPLEELSSNGHTAQKGKLRASLLSEDDWETLLGRIREGKCTPFLGAGANAGVLPTGISLAKTWAEFYKYPLQDKHDLTRVAQYVATKKQDEMWPKEEVLRSFKKTISGIDLRAHLQRESGPLKVLAELPLPVYMTTNYDDFMIQALKLQGKEPHLEVCRWNEFLQKKQRSILGARSSFTPTKDHPIVFHLHGHIDCAESLVLTEDDYLDFLISINRQQELLPPRIQESLTYSSLLFVGYRLADLNFRVLFRSLFKGMEDSLRRISLAIQLPHEDGPEAQMYLDEYFRKANIKLFWGDAREFAAELRSRWRRSQK